MASARPRRASMAVVMSCAPATITRSRHAPRATFRARRAADPAARCGPRPVWDHTATPATGCRAIHAAYPRCAASVDAPCRGTAPAPRAAAPIQPLENRRASRSPRRSAVVLPQIALLLDDDPERHADARDARRPRGPPPARRCPMTFTSSPRRNRTIPSTGRPAPYASPRPGETASLLGTSITSTLETAGDEQGPRRGRIHDPVVLPRMWPIHQAARPAEGLGIARLDRGAILRREVEQVELGHGVLRQCEAAGRCRTRSDRMPTVRSRVARWSSGGPQIQQMSHQIRAASSGVEPKCTSSMKRRSAWVTSSRAAGSQRISARTAAAGNSARAVVGMALAPVLEPDRKQEREAGRAAGGRETPHRRAGRVECRRRSDRSGPPGAPAAAASVEHVSQPGSAGMHRRHRPEALGCRARGLESQALPGGRDLARTRRAGG